MMIFICQIYYGKLLFLFKSEFCVLNYNFIYRWIREGHFHVNRLNLFLPENVEHGINYAYLIHISTRNGFNLELSMLLNHFKANQLPEMDFNKLVIRFCDELQLPSNDNILFYY